MSCDGCIYNTKTAGCNFSYPCNTSGIPIAKAVSTETKASDKKKRRGKGHTNEAPKEA